MNLLVNKKNNHWQIISNLWEEANEIDIAVAFLTDGGYSIIRKLIEQALKEKVRVRLVIGLNMMVSSPDALLKLYKISSENRLLRLYLADMKDATFHPKLYLFKTSKKVYVVIGSANLTKNAWEKNEELSVLNHFPPKDNEAIEIQSYFNSLLEKNYVSGATYLQLQQYKGKYEKIQKAIEKAEEEISEEPYINKKLLNQYYEKYLNSKDEQIGLKDKIERYKEAKKNLKEISNSSINKKKFIDLYSELIGASGYRHLWHSNGLFRRKESVIKNYKKTAALIKYIEENYKHKSTSQIFDEVLEKSKSINGLSYNIFTEMLTTYDSKRFTVLNDNPLKSLKSLNVELKGKTSFKGGDYAQYCELITLIGKDLDISNLQEVDHFLSFIYMDLRDKKQL